MGTAPFIRIGCEGRGTRRREVVDIGVIEVLTIIFIVLKLIGLINWRWLWVLSPVWIFYGGLLFIALMKTIKKWLEDSGL